MVAVEVVAVVDAVAESLILSLAAVPAAAVLEEGVVVSLMVLFSSRLVEAAIDMGGKTARRLNANLNASILAHNCRAGATNSAVNPSIPLIRNPRVNACAANKIFSLNPPSNSR